MPRTKPIPPREELYELVWTKPTIEIAGEFGVSDKAVDKWCKRLSVPKPSPGYWARVAAGQKGMKLTTVFVAWWRRLPAAFECGDGFPKRPPISAVSTESPPFQLRRPGRTVRPFNRRLHGEAEW